jgi:hypothetical protein
MRRSAIILASAAVLLVLGVVPVSAVNNGLLDDTSHPAVGLLVGSQDLSGCNGQAVGCSGVLIAPDVFLTTASCTEAFNEALATPGFITHVWVTFEPNDPFDCSKFVPVASLTGNPDYDPSRQGVGNVGVALLSSSASVTPAELPPANDLFSLARSQPYTVVAYGTESGGNVLTTQRRFASARSLGFTSEILALTFKVGGPIPSCIGGLNEGGGAFVDSTNKVEALVTVDKGGCNASSTYQRLDVPSVRTFLSDFVSLP